MLAVLYLACRIEKAARLISDLIVADPNVTESNVQKYFWKLNKILQTISSDSLVREHQTQGPEAFLNRYGSRLELVQFEVTAENIAKQISNTSALLGARNPAVIAAVSLYIVSHLADAANKPSIDRLAQLTQLKPHTLRNCYLSLKQHIHRFLPQDFLVKLPGGIAALPT
jgi:transcription initiation factor TFIIIB Brf1 subunit/transcription initiation factor TFIIB